MTSAETDEGMSLFDHLGELRRSIVWAVLGMLPGVVLAWNFKEYCLDWLLKPFTQVYIDLDLGKPQIHFANPGELFIAYVKLSVVVGFLISSPWVFWQVWRFIAPGLYKKEKLYSIPFVLASSLCFAGGAYFGYEEIFPLCFRFFLEMAGDLPSQSIQVQPTIMIGEYLSMANGMLLAFGAVFELPVVVSLLAVLKLITWRSMWRFGRWWIVIASVVAAVLTPADPWSMFAVFVPLVALYYFSIILAWILGPKPEKTTKNG